MTNFVRWLKSAARTWPVQKLRLRWKATSPFVVESTPRDLVEDLSNDRAWRREISGSAAALLPVLATGLLATQLLIYCRGDWTAALAVLDNLTLTSAVISVVAVILLSGALAVLIGMIEIVRNRHYSRTVRAAVSISRLLIGLLLTLILGWVFLLIGLGISVLFRLAFGKNGEDRAEVSVLDWAQKPAPSIDEDAELQSLHKELQTMLSRSRAELMAQDPKISDRDFRSIVIEDSEFLGLQRKVLDRSARIRDARQRHWRDIPLDLARIMLGVQILSVFIISPPVLGQRVQVTFQNESVVVGYVVQRDSNRAAVISERSREVAVVATTSIKSIDRCSNDFHESLFALITGDRLVAHDPGMPAPANCATSD